MENKNLNYFSKFENKFVSKFKNIKGILLLPIVKLLAKIKCTPDMLSYIGLFSLLGFIYYVAKNPIYSLIFLMFHVIIDAFDGPLAILTKRDSDGGAFTDIVCDHTGMFIVVFTLAYMNIINQIYSIIYIYVYTVLIVFLVIRNIMNTPIRIAIRTKYLVYLLYLVYVLFNVNYLNYAILIFIIIMLPSVFTSYFVIKKHLNNK